MDDIKMAKYERFIENIDDKIGGRINLVTGSKKVGVNTVLALIYDYHKCNDYAKVIMDKSSLKFYSKESPYTAFSSDRDYIDPWRTVYPNYKVFKDSKIKVRALKKLIELNEYKTKGITGIGYIEVNSDEKYKLIFWALMILTVDKSDAEEHLVHICELAKLLGIKEDEFEDIVQIIKIVYSEIKGKYTFKSNEVDRIFSSIL